LAYVRDRRAAAGWFYAWPDRLIAAVTEGLTRLSVGASRAGMTHEIDRKNIASHRIHHEPLD
jgi:hypothetical protein